MFKLFVFATLVAACSAVYPYVGVDRTLVHDDLRPSGGYALAATDEKAPASTVHGKHITAPVLRHVVPIAPVAHVATIARFAPIPAVPIAHHVGISPYAYAI